MKSVLAAGVLLLLSQAGVAQAPPPAPAPRVERLALVIGNAAYKDAPLLNPVNDATDMAKALQASGFTVMKRENATLRDMHLALREFGDRLGRQSTGLVYFSGHGLQVRGRNYLLPVDADIAREDEVAFQALDLGAVMEKLDTAKNPVNIVILDACRNNPFGNRLQATAKGLATVDAPPGTLIAFSTAPGSTAADGTGRNGLYTHHLVRHLESPGLAIEEVFKAVRAGVRVESKSAQVPWESTSLESAFRFREAPRAAPPKVAAAKPAAATPPSAPRAVPASLGAAPRFAVGDTWTYRVLNQIDGRERQLVIRVVAIRGEEVHHASGSITDPSGNFTRIVRNAERVENYSPSSNNYLFPLQTGATSLLKSVQQTGERTYDLNIELKVAGEEEVQVGAGKMRTLRIERVTKWKQRNSKNAGVNILTHWYSSAVKRPVLSEQLQTTSEGKVLLNERMELTAYAVK